MLNTIKKILSKNKNACVIIIEDDKPAYVMTSFEEYERLSGNANNPQRELFPQQDESVLEEVNREIINLGAPQEANIQIIEDSPQEEQGMQEIKIEDIPL